MQYTFSAENPDVTSLNILVNAVIPGIMRPTYCKIDNEIILSWAMESAESLETYLKGRSRGGLFGILRGLCSAVLAAENFMLESSRILMSEAYVYADVRTGAAALICIPDELLAGDGVYTVYETRDGIENILNGILSDRNEYSDVTVRDAGAALEILSEIPVFSPGDYSVRLAMATPGTRAENSGKPAGKEADGASEDGALSERDDEIDRIISRFDGFCADEKKKADDCGKESKPAGKIEDSVITFGFLLKNFSGKNLKVYLESLRKNRRVPFSVAVRTEKSVKRFLTDAGSGKRHEITQYPFSIGKSGKCSLTLDGTRFVSRYHAELTLDGGSVYIRDTGSTNGTYVGGVRLDSGEIVKLKAGDAIAVGEMLLVFSEE
ncbi:MAG: FHA domain-containing protein [Clostridia bacterium]|nr:FHA domain-containing protein [Clostridia bacterium]